VGKDFRPGGLRYWAHRLRRGSKPAPAEDTAAAAPEPAPHTPIVLEFGAACLGVRRGFGPQVLCSVLDVLERWR
jgi:hypothetical protein